MKKLLSFIALFGAAAYAANVAEVLVKASDNFGGDMSSVLARCQTREGAPYDEVAVQRDVASLKASNEFQEISADSEETEDGVKVTFHVKRKARFTAPLKIEGNDALSESKIRNAAGLKDGNLYSEGELADAADKVAKAYLKKDYPNVMIAPVVTPIAEGGGNDVTITFMINEGERMKISDYVFDGAVSVEVSELKKAIDVYPWWNPRGWITDEPISNFDLKKAAETIAKKYRDLGYLDVEVSMPERVKDETGRVNVRFAIEEGKLYKIGSIAIEGLTKYSDVEVAKNSKLPALGEVAGEQTLEDAAHRIAITVGSGDLGLNDTQVDVRRVPCEDSEDKLDIVFVVREGYPVIINNIVITGNDYTKDKVIRREIELGPGDRMLDDRAERSKNKLENLNYFSRVRYYLRETNRPKLSDGTEYRDLVYEIDENNHRTGNFMIGVGASSIDSVYVSAEISQSNFDLFAPGKWFRGGGQKGRAYVQVGPRIQTYEVSVTEPHLFDRLLELTVEAYRRMRWYDNYDLIRSGAAATLSYPVKFWPTWESCGRFGFRLSGEFIQMDDVDKYTLIYKGREVSYRQEDHKYGDAFEPVLRMFWRRNTCNSYRSPSEGSRTELFVDYAPFGDNQYYRLGFNHRTYFPVWRRFNHVLMAAFRAETIDGISDDVPIYNRMFLGGPKSIRGIDYRNVAPYARRGEEGHSWDPWGGQTLVCANFEYTVPIVKMLRVAAFTDIGSVGADSYDISDDFAWTVGLGLRIDIPMFPIRLDFGVPIEKPSHADKEVFSFTAGYEF